NRESPIHVLQALAATLETERMTMEVVPVGWVESPLTEMARAPRQPDEGAPPAWLVFEAGVADALRDLRPGTEILVLTWLDRADRSVLLTIPRGDPRNPMTGVFSTRSPVGYAREPGPHGVRAPAPAWSANQDGDFLDGRAGFGLAEPRQEQRGGRGGGHRRRADPDRRH